MISLPVGSGYPDKYSYEIAHGTYQGERLSRGKIV